METRQFNVLELRRYVTRPGRRDDLVSLFEREFIETQESCGMSPVGHYRDIEDADSFVWIRGFERMEVRRRALEAFYLNSRAWLDHRDAANATMIDSDNVLLLRPARPESGFDLSGLRRPTTPEGGPCGSVVAVSVVMLERAAGVEQIAAFEQELLPALRRIAQRVAYFVTEETANDFLKLPVREGEFAFVAAGICSRLQAAREWMAAFDDGLPLRIRARLRRHEPLYLEPARRALFR